MSDTEEKNKEKIFYGPGRPPKGTRRPTMIESALAHQVRYHGVKKIDPTLLASKITKGVDIKPLKTELAVTRAKYNKLVQEIKNPNTPPELKAIKLEELRKLKDIGNSLLNKIKQAEEEQAQGKQKYNIELKKRKEKGQRGRPKVDKPKPEKKPKAERPKKRTAEEVSKIKRAEAEAIEKLKKIKENLKEKMKEEVKEEIKEEVKKNVVVPIEPIYYDQNYKVPRKGKKEKIYYDENYIIPPITYDNNKAIISFSGSTKKPAVSIAQQRKNKVKAPNKRIQDLKKKKINKYIMQTQKKNILNPQGIITNYKIQQYKKSLPKPSKKYIKEQIKAEEEKQIINPYNKPIQKIKIQRMQNPYNILTSYKLQQLRK